LKERPRPEFSSGLVLFWDTGLPKRSNAVICAGRRAVAIIGGDGEIFRPREKHPSA
jgi:hypothetical protein